MAETNFHKIWVAQCDACAAIRAQYGLSAAFDYIVVEKLTNFVEAAISNPEFARELPTFVAEVRRLFTAAELQAEMARHDRTSPQRIASAITTTQIRTKTIRVRSFQPSPRWMPPTLL